MYMNKFNLLQIFPDDFENQLNSKQHSHNKPLNQNYLTQISKICNQKVMASNEIRDPPILNQRSATILARSTNPFKYDFTEVLGETRYSELTNIVFLKSE